MLLSFKGEVPCFATWISDTNLHVHQWVLIPCLSRTEQVAEREPREAEFSLLDHFVCAIWKQANMNHVDICLSKFCQTE